MQIGDMEDPSEDPSGVGAIGAQVPAYPRGNVGECLADEAPNPFVLCNRFLPHVNDRLDAASALAGVCGEDSQGSCEARVYQEVCYTRGSSDAPRMTEAIGRLEAASEATSCATFREPGAAADCVQEAYSGLINEGVCSTASRIEEACSITVNRTQICAGSLECMEKPLAP